MTLNFSAGWKRGREGRDEWRLNGGNRKRTEIEGGRNRVWVKE